MIDYNNDVITQIADLLFQRADSETQFIKAAYEFVRDRISHSADINEDIITCCASEVLKAGHGICFAKSHLLAALLHCKAVPTGLCYKKLILDDETAPVLIYHGLNGVYIKEYKKWIRLDARGNKEGVNAQFSLDEEYLAFPVRPEKGGEDYFTVCFVATENGKITGFACYDSSAMGFFGPIGVEPTRRGEKIGQALLVRTLSAMKEYG